MSASLTVRRSPLIGEDMSQASSNKDDMKSIRVWLYCLAGLVVLMVVVGGATRLTGSGLSITEWRPLTGTLPPLSQHDWLLEFDKYRRSSQYLLLNAGMSLEEFKQIYAWEWAHRLLGRLIGIVFFMPLLWFVCRKKITLGLTMKLIGIGALGALQGCVGWIMVASGLEPGMIAVAPIKLMAHMLLASLILVALIRLAIGIRPISKTEIPSRFRKQAAIVPILVLVQIALGALVAGSKAGLVYDSWPLMDGEFLPGSEKLFVALPWFENFVDNALLVQFNHRMFAYLIVGYAIWHAASATKAMAGTAFAIRAVFLALLVSSQMILGIATLVLGVPLWTALAHQFLAMVMLAFSNVHSMLCVANERQTATKRRRIIKFIRS